MLRVPTLTSSIRTHIIGCFFEAIENLYDVENIKLMIDKGQKEQADAIVIQALNSLIPQLKNVRKEVVFKEGRRLLVEAESQLPFYLSHDTALMSSDIDAENNSQLEEARRYLMELIKQYLKNPILEQGAMVKAVDIELGYVGVQQNIAPKAGDKLQAVENNEPEKIAAKKVLAEPQINPEVPDCPDYSYYDAGLVERLAMPPVPDHAPPIVPARLEQLPPPPNCAPPVYASLAAPIEKNPNGFYVPQQAAPEVLGRAVNGELAGAAGGAGVNILRQPNLSVFDAPPKTVFSPAPALVRPAVPVPGIYNSNAPGMPVARRELDKPYDLTLSLLILGGPLELHEALKCQLDKDVVKHERHIDEVGMYFITRKLAVAGKNVAIRIADCGRVDHEWLRAILLHLKNVQVILMPFDLNDEEAFKFSKDLLENSKDLLVSESPRIVFVGTNSDRSLISPDELMSLCKEHHAVPYFIDFTKASSIKEFYEMLVSEQLRPALLPSAVLPPAALPPAALPPAPLPPAPQQAPVPIGNNGNGLFASHGDPAALRLREIHQSGPDKPTMRIYLLGGTFVQHQIIMERFANGGAIKGELYDSIQFYNASLQKTAVKEHTLDCGDYRVMLIDGEQKKVESHGFNFSDADALLMICDLSKNEISLTHYICQNFAMIPPDDRQAMDITLVGINNSGLSVNDTLRGLCSQYNCHGALPPQNETPEYLIGDTIFLQTIDNVLKKKMAMPSERCTIS